MEIIKEIATPSKEYRLTNIDGRHSIQTKSKDSQKFHTLWKFKKEVSAKFILDVFNDFVWADRRNGRISLNPDLLERW